MKKHILLYFTLIIISCGSSKIKIIENQDQQRKKLVGKIEQITFETNYIDNKEKLTLFFDNKNRIIKTIYELNERAADTTINVYEKNLLRSNRIIFGDTGQSLDHYYKYNNKNNLVLDSISEKPSPIIEYKYDKYNNIIEETTSLFVNNSKTVYSYDYKNKTRIFKIYNDKDQIIRITKQYFDNKGNITKIYESYNGSLPNEKTGYTEIIYDKYNNVKCRKIYGTNNEQIKSSCYNYRYDKKGNIVAYELFVNNILSENAVYKIIYRK